MKSIRLLTFGLLAAMLLGSCNKDEGAPEQGDQTAVQFSTAITKMSGSTWDNGDQIGVFMLNTGGTMPGDIVGTPSAADNVLYTNAAGGFTTATPIYYPQSGAVDFVAYYPYKPTGTGADQINSYIYKVDLSQSTPTNVQANPAAIDLLYSNNATNKTRSTAAVNLNFTHALSQIQLNIKAGNGMTAADLSGVSVKITGMPTTVDFALADGTFSNLGGTTAEIAPIAATTASGYVASYKAIVIPQAASAYSGRKLVFTVGSESYEYAIPASDDFAQGKIQPYNVSVNAKSITVTRGEITDWTGIGSSEDLGEVAQIPIPQTVKITAGSFQMGSPDSDGDAWPDEKPQHWVKLTQDFYMGKYEITNAQYAAFLNAQGISSDGKGNVTYSKDGGAPVTEQQTLISGHNWGVQWSGTESKWLPATDKDNFPVINVRWYGAMAYCNWLSEQTGQTWTLPTEAQWEYACRAGTATIYSYGNTADADYMWYSNNSGSATHEVGTKLPNPWGLYDMHGNVYDWCLDQWNGNNNYPTAATEDEAVVDPYVTAGSNRVLRGGSWLNAAQLCRSAYRFSADPGIANGNVGFRVVLVPSN